MNDQLPRHLKRAELSWNDKQCIMLIDKEQVLRYIRKEYAAHFQNLYDSGLIQKLVSKGLLQPGEIKETGIPDYPLVIEHPLIPFLSYPFEWPAAILKEAALIILEIESEANKLGYSLYDPHPWNIVVYRGYPIYLDYGSFAKIRNEPTWQGFDSYFRYSFLIPLLLYHKGSKWLARSLLRDYWNRPPRKEIERLVPHLFRRPILDRLKLGIIILENSVRPRIRENIVRFTSWLVKESELRASFLQYLNRVIKHMQVSEKNSPWVNYYDNVNSLPPWKRDESNWTVKECNMWEMMRQLRPGTVLDIGCNTGWFSIMAAGAGASVVSFDSDESSVEQLYTELRKTDADVLPLVMDMNQPTPTCELGIGTILSASQRFRCELVMALGFIHHLVVDQKITLERLVYLISNFAQKYLVIEFIPVGDQWAQMGFLTEEDWNIKVIESAFNQYFYLQNVCESYPQGRKLLLFCRHNTD